MTRANDTVLLMEPLKVEMAKPTSEDFARNQVRFDVTQRARLTNMNELVAMFGSGVIGTVQRRTAERPGQSLIHQDTDDWVTTLLAATEDVLTSAAIAVGENRRALLRHHLYEMAAVVAEWAIDNERND